MSAELWKMPEWMEKYRGSINYTAGKSVEHWHNCGSDKAKDFDSWFSKAIVCAQTTLLEKLYDSGGLK